MRRSTVIPCRGSHRVCETCAVLAAPRCPICNQLYRRQRQPCLLTNAVAKVLFPHEDLNPLSPDELRAYRVSVLIEHQTSIAHHTASPATWTRGMTETLHRDGVAAPRCLCRKPDVPGGFVVLPAQTAGGKRFVGCPCFQRDTPNSGCGYFRWL